MATQEPRLDPDIAGVLRCIFHFDLLRRFDRGRFFLTCGIDSL
jgi:hypothetical protein